MSKKDFISKCISCLGIILSFFVVFIVVYSPVLLKGFFYLTDYGIFGIDKLNKTEIISLTVNQGRIVEGFLLNILSDNIQSSESTKAIRLIGIIGIALFASVVYAIFKKFRCRTDHAFLMSILICTLPSLQILVSWVVVIPSVYSAFLSSLSALLMFKVIFKQQDKGRTYTLISVLAAMILLITALNINQPPAMMYWAMGVFFIFAGDNFEFSKNTSHPYIKYFSVGLSCIMIYYIVFIIIIPFIINVSVDRGGLITIWKLPQKLEWFLKLPFKNAANLWNMHPTYKFAFFICVIILAGIIFSLLQGIKDKRQFPVINFLQKSFLLLSMITLSYFPNLIVAENWYPYRTLVSLSVALSVLLCFGLINIVEFFRFIPNFSSEARNTIITLSLTLLVIVTTILAHNNVKKWAALHSNELKYARDVIREYGISYLLSTSKIYIRRPRPPVNISPNLPDEFRGPLTTYSEARVPDVIKLALYELGVKQDIQITQGAADDPVPKDKNVLIIDMTKYKIL